MPPFFENKAKSFKKKDVAAGSHDAASLLFMLLKDTCLLITFDVWLEAF